MHGIRPPGARGAFRTAVLRLRSDPRPAESVALDTMTDPRVRRLRPRLKTGPHPTDVPWRALYVVFDMPRVVYVGAVVPRDEETYSAEQIEVVARAAKEFRVRWKKQHPKRNPLALDARVRAVLTAHPNWSDAKIAETAGCGPTAVRKRRHAWGVPARHVLPWKPWEKTQ